MRQFGFDFVRDYKKEHGGSLALGKRKSRRPFSTKHPLLLTLKSQTSSYFNPTNWALEKLIKSQARKYKITIYKISLNWTHIHVLLKFPSKEAYLAFIRTVTARIIDLLEEKTKRSLTGLFDLLPHTKILTWGRQFNIVKEYHDLNDQEARGMIRRKKKSAPSAKIKKSD